MRLHSRSDIAVIPLLLLLAGCQQIGSAPLPSVKQALPSLALRMADGTVFPSERLAGKVVLVNFWSPG